LRAFLGFEASSLGRHGFPVEVAWAFERGGEESHSIRPESGWAERGPAAQLPRRISGDRLSSEGEPVERVARRLVEQLGDHEVLACDPSWDCKWLSLLLCAAGLPSRAVRLVDSDLALLELAGAILAPSLPSSDIPRAARQILAAASARFAASAPAHRALPDARIERERWFAVSELAHAFPLQAELR
jgi:hypothetical protein